MIKLISTEYVNNDDLHWHDIVTFFIILNYEYIIFHLFLNKMLNLIIFILFTFY